MIVLTEEEIVAITGGKIRPSAQARELDFLGIPHKPRRDGTLVVFRIHAEGVTPGSDARLSPPEPVLQP